MPKELTENDRDALEKYLFEVKAQSFGAAYSEELNAKHRSSLNMEI